MKSQTKLLPSDRLTGWTNFVRRRFSAKGYLGLHFTVGLIVLVIAGWIFGEITEDVVTQDPSLKIDQVVADFLHDRATPAMIHVMEGLSFLGSGRFLIPLTVLVVAWLGWKRLWLRVMLTVAAIGGGTLVNVAIKKMIHRGRPVFTNPIATLDSFSFPSGHTMASTLFYGLMALFVVVGNFQWRTKVTAVVAASVLVALIGLSRMYLGLHFLSDVLGAMAAGGAWLALCVAGVEIYRRKEARTR